MISAALAATVGLSLYGVLTQRSVLRVLICLQVLFSATLLALAALGSSDRAKEMALLVLVLSQLQALAGVGYVVRMHYLKAKGAMNELESLSN